MTEEQKTERHYEALLQSSPKGLVDLIKMQDRKIAELKKQVPVWHDLRKDPNDLPKFRMDILVTCEYKNKLKKKCETFEWDYKSDMLLHAIAWCEIPQFEE